MPTEEGSDLWQVLGAVSDVFATEEDYEHGYVRELRGDLEQYIAFEVCGETYAVSIDHIAEISKPMVETEVPRTASFVRGIANVRGTIIPIIDLARRLHLSPRAMGRDTRVLIVRHGAELCGVLIDKVVGVIPIAPETLEEAPGAIGATRGDFIRSLARYSDDASRKSVLIIVLDLKVVLDPDAFLQVGRNRRRSA